MTPRRIVTVTVGVPVAAVALLATQAYLTARSERPDVDPTYEVATTVGAGGEPLRLTVLGDSTAAGVGAPTLEGALPVLVAERVAATLGRRVHVIGHGVSGARTDDTRVEQVPLLEGTDPDVVVITVGSNDVTHLTPPWVLRRQTSELLAAARAASAPAGTGPSAGVPVVLAGIPLFEGATALPQPLRSVVVAYAGPLRNAQREAALAADGVRLVEIARDASPRFRDVPDAMSADGYHPAPTGYGFWADAIAPEVVAALGEAQATPTSSQR